MRAIVMTVVGLVGAAPAAGAPASDSVELHGVVGAHVFADDVELGVHDIMEIQAPQSFALFGLRLSLRLFEPVAFETEAVVIPTTDALGGRVTVIGVRGQLRLDLPLGRVRPFLVGGAGALLARGEGNEYDTIADDTDPALHWGAGLRIALGRSWVLRLDGRHLIVPNTTVDGATSDFELHAAFGVRFGGGRAAVPVAASGAIANSADLDADEDGIADAVDRCPSEAEDRDGYQDEDGCIDVDDDGDGIIDRVDRCPRVAETVNGVDDQDGCPEEDVDGDGLVAGPDRCPLEPEDRDGFQDDDGCPDADNDQDTVADVVDRCVNEPEDLDGFDDADGCPEIDNDQDAIPDVVDACPGEAEVFNGVQDDDGCPDPGDVLVVVTPEKLEIREQVRFEKDKAKIKRDSYLLLATVAKILLLHPEIRKLRIEGHTDARGSRERNLKLSQQRADALRRHLIEVNGLEPERLEAVGYGPDRPAFDNDTEAGRKDNRRVEFVIRERE